MNTPTRQQQEKVIFQQLKDGIDLQSIANKMNVSIYEYLLDDGTYGRCFVADLKTTNSFYREDGTLAYVVKCINTIEPETTGHKEFSHFSTSRKGAEDFGIQITEQFVNTHFHVEMKQTKRGKLYKVTISNLTDEQYQSL